MRKNRKKIAKAMLLAISLTLGATLGEALFKEVQAGIGLSIPAKGSYYAVNAYNGSYALCACTLNGNQCITYHGWANFC